MTDYIWYYSGVSFAFLAVTAVYYHIQRRIPDMADRLYSIMLISCTTAALFEAFSTAIMPFEESWPVWSLYLFHIILLLALQICLPTCVMYIRALAGIRPKGRWSWDTVLLIPFFIVFVLILISPFGRNGVFYIAQDHSYQYGATHAVLFIASALYFAIGFVSVARYRHNISKRDSTVLVLFCTVIVLTIALQLVYPQYLLTVTAIGIAIVAVFHSMQSQSNYVDTVTDVFDRFAMDRLMGYEYSLQRNFTVIIYSLDNFPLAEHTLGSKNSAVLLWQFAQYLVAQYPKQSVIRMSLAKFAVLASSDALPKTPPAVWEVGDTQITLVVRVAIARGADFPRREDMAAVLDYIMETAVTEPGLITADENMLQLAKRAGASASALGRQLSGGSIGIAMQPLYHGGRIWGQEILPASDDPALFGVDAAELIRLAAESGSAAHLCETLLRGGCEYMRAMGDSPEAPARIGVFMPLALYMRAGVSERIAALVREYSVEPQQVCLLISEYLPDEELAAARENISALMKLGFGVLLEHFGTGSAGLNTLADLSDICVRMDSALLLDAVYDTKRRTMVAGIYRLLEELNVPVIYSDLETERQGELLGRLGAT